MTTIEVHPKELGFAIKAVTPHIAAGVMDQKLMPGICGVLFELMGNGNLRLTATDRYTIARSLVPQADQTLAGPAEPGRERVGHGEVQCRILVGRGDVQLLARWLPSQKGPRIPIVFEGAAGTGDEGPRTEGAAEGPANPEGAADAAMFGYGGAAGGFTVAGQTDEFPRTRPLFGGPFGFALNEVRFNGDYLARFSTKILARNTAEKETAVVFSFNKPARPVHVSFSDHFEGLIMPMGGRR